MRPLPAEGQQRAKIWILYLVGFGIGLSSDAALADYLAPLLIGIGVGLALAWKTPWT